MTHRQAEAWLVETGHSVVKRKFGDTPGARTEQNEPAKTDPVMEAQVEQLPDARQLVQMNSAAHAAPALHALSLADLESALNPNAVAEAIPASGVRFTSGGITGGSGPRWRRSRTGNLSRASKAARKCISRCASRSPSA